MLQGAVPDVAYTDPGDGKEKIVELKFVELRTEVYKANAPRRSTVGKWQHLYVPL